MTPTEHLSKAMDARRDQADRLQDVAAKAILDRPSLFDLIRTEHHSTEGREYATRRTDR